MAEYIFVGLPLMPRAFGSVPIRPTIRNTLNKGDGYLAGEFPRGTTTVEGVPTAAVVRVLLRTLSGDGNDGMVVTETASAPDGTWRVDDLPLEFRYDVVGRKEGFNDVIVAGVTPTSMVDITYAGAVVENETFTGAVGFLELVGGIPPYSATAETPLPSGLFPVVSGRNLIIDGTTGADEVASFDVKVTSSNGAEKIIPLQLVVGFKAPANFKAETVVVDDIFSVALTWEVTNTTQQIKVYRSATPFDMDDLPEPIATLSGTSTTYTDDDVIEDDRFYYMVTAICEQYELESEAVAVLVTEGDPHWDNVVALLHFDANLADEAAGLWEYASGTAGFSEGVFGSALQPSGSINLISPSEPSVTNLIGHDFTIEFFIKPEGSGNQTILTNRDPSPAGGSYPGTLVRLTSTRTILFTHLGQPVNLISSSIPQGVYSHVAICWDSDSRRIYINGIEDVRDINQSGWVAGQPKRLRIGYYHTGRTDRIHSPIDELRITKGVARYTENFTPPNKPFPNK